MKNNVIMPVAAEGTGTVQQEGDITMKQPVYTFRRLNSTDMFLMFKIVGKIGINEFASCLEKDSVKKMIAKATRGESSEDATTMVGLSVILEMVNIIMCNLPKCEDEIYQMLSNVSGMKVDRIKKLDMCTFTEMVIDFIKKEEFKDFFKVVLRLFKQEK